MKLESIKIAGEVFTPEEIKGARFQTMFFQTYQNILSQKNADSFIVQSGLETLKKLSENPTLGIIEELALQCLTVRTNIDLILSGETEASYKEKLAGVSAENMVDLTTLCKSEEDVNYMIASIENDTHKKSDFECIVEIFQDIDTSKLNKETYANICGFLREFNFNGILLSILEVKHIRVLRNQNNPKDVNIILQTLSPDNKPFFYLEGQLSLKMKEIIIENPRSTGEKYYTGITFGGKKGIIVIYGNKAYTQVLDEPIQINTVDVIILKDIFGGGHHLYFPKENKITLLSSVIVGMYHIDVNGYKIDEDDEDFQKKILQTGVKQIMRLILDVEKGFFYDFDGESFGELKIKTENMILGRIAQKQVH